VSAVPTPAPRTGELRELGDALTRIAGALLERGVLLQEALDAFELRFLLAAVQRHDGNLSHAATELGIHRNTLRSKLQRNGHRAR